MKKATFGALLGFTLLLAGRASAQTYSITDLGPLNGSSTYATSIANGGLVAGYASASGSTAWLWQSGTGYTNLGSFGGNYNIATAIGADGSVYGTSQTSLGLDRGFRWSNGTLSDIGSVVSGDSVTVTGVNATRVIAGTTVTGGAQQGFTLSGGTFSLIGTLQGADSPAYSAANAVNASGQLTGVASWVNGGTRAILVQPGGTMLSLGTLGGNYSTAYGINDAGQVVGDSLTASGQTHGFVYFPGVGMEDLSVLSGGAGSSARGINAINDIVGSALDSTGTSHAVVWPAGGGIKDLNQQIPPTTGWTLLERATAIDAGGDIVGYGIIGGQEHAFLLTQYTGPDTTPPVAILTNNPQPAYQGISTIQANIEFWDFEKVVSASAQIPGAIHVRGPNGFDAAGTVNSWTTNDNQIVNIGVALPAPGSAGWGAAANGTYQIYVEPNVISNRAGLTMPYTVVGSFTIGYETVPILTLAGLPSTTTVGTPVSLTLSAVGSYPNSPSDVFNFSIDWDGNGQNVQAVSGTTNTVVSHTYSQVGTHIVRVSCIDPNSISSGTSTVTISVTPSPATIPATSVLATQLTFVYPSIAALSGSTIYCFGYAGASSTPVASWNYITSGSFVSATSLTGDAAHTYGGAGVDGRGRVIIFGGSDSDNAALANASSYPSSGSVASMPGAIASGITTNDGSKRMCVYSPTYNVFYRYTSGTSGAGSWETLPAPDTAAAGGMAWDGNDHIIIFSSTPWVYSISGNSWSQPLSAPATFGRAALGADGLVYCVSSYQLWTFDPVQNTFAEVATTTADQSTGFVFKGVDGFLYMMRSSGLSIETFDTRPAATRLPIISSVPATTLIQSVPWTYTIAASGKPRPTYFLDYGPAGMSVDSNTGVVSWIPTPSQVGAQLAELLRPIAPDLKAN